MTSQRWQPGDVLDGFTLGELIHPGGMGAIFRVMKPGLTFPAVMGGRAWANSTASSVTANAGCSVHVVRVPKP